MQVTITQQVVTEDGTWGAENAELEVSAMWEGRVELPPGAPGGTVDPGTVRHLVLPDIDVAKVKVFILEPEGYPDDDAPVLYYNFKSAPHFSEGILADSHILTMPWAFIGGNFQLAASWLTEGQTLLRMNLWSSAQSGGAIPVRVRFLW